MHHVFFFSSALRIYSTAKEKRKKNGLVAFLKCFIIIDGTKSNENDVSMVRSFSIAFVNQISRSTLLPFDERTLKFSKSIWKNMIDTLLVQRYKKIVSVC